MEARDVDRPSEPSEEPDDWLVARCTNELPYQTGAFEILLRRYEPVVFRTCLRYLGNRQEAEEAAQDAFLRVFHGLPKFRADAQFRTWLYRIVANVCATRFAKLRREAERRRDYQQHIQDTARLSYESVETELQISGPVAEALDQLSHEDRQVIVLRHVSDLTVPEMAEVLGAKLSAAKMRLHRAENRLREGYERILGKSDDIFSGL